MTARLISGLAFALAVAATGLTTPAAALDDDGKAGLFDAVTGLIGFGAAKQGPELDYRQRPPLVVPPKTALPQPAQRGEKSAAWPQDPDVIRRRDAAARARAPMGLPSDSAGVMLSKRELLAGRAAGNDRAPAGQEPGCRGQGCVWLHPDQLRSQGVLKEQAPSLVVGQEPGRDWLTQPPKGYRRATQQTGVGAIQPRIAGSNEASPFYFLVKPFRKDDDE